MPPLDIVAGAGASAFALGGIPLSAADSLRVRTWGTVASVAVRISGWRRMPDGLVVAISERHVPNSDRTAATSTFLLGEGSLLELSVVVETTQVPIGRLYARADIVRGGAATPLYITTVAAGNITRELAINFPRSPIMSSRDVQPAVRSITGTNPAAGAEISETVPTGAIWRVMSMVTTLVTDATVITRTPGLILDDATNAYYFLGAIQTVAASLTRRITWAHGLGTVVDSNQNHGGALPTDLKIPGGHRIRSSTLSLQAGDDYGAPQLLVEEQFEAD